MWQFQKISKFQFFSEGEHQCPEGGGCMSPLSPPQLTYVLRQAFAKKN